MKTNKVKHHTITGSVSGDCEQEAFPEAMHKALNGMVDYANKRYGATVDWTTLRIEPGEEIFAVQASGEREVFAQPLQITVDAVFVEITTIQEKWQGMDPREDVQDAEPEDGPEPPMTITHPAGWSKEAWAAYEKLMRGERP